MSQPAMTPAEFEQALRAKGALYHIHHPFHVAMYDGSATREQIQGWVANRFYYQVCIPVKDAAILANCPDRDTRREWIQRIIDHDGEPGSEGGIEAWLRLAESVGLDRQQMLSQELVLPGVRFAVDAYVNFARRASWQEAASSSLTELFAPQIHQSRLDAWPQHYPWIDASGYDIRLEVDGGVSEKNIREVAAAGADTFVAGSAIFGKDDYAAVIQQMREELAQA